MNLGGFHECHYLILSGPYPDTPELTVFRGSGRLLVVNVIANSFNNAQGFSRRERETGFKIADLLAREAVGCKPLLASLMNFSGCNKLATEMSSSIPSQ